VEAAERLAADAIDQLPVVEDGRLVGLVSVTELSAYLPQSLLKPAVDRADWAAEVEDEAPVGVSVGDAVTFSKAVRDEDVAAFARISGDENPLHLDESFAAKTRFGRRIVHGLLAASLFSAALSRLPGLVIYLSQDVRFLAPVDVGDRVRVRCEVIQNLGNDRFRLSTEGHDGDDRVLVGEAVVLVDAVSGEE
jgi:acyl dehydratase